MSISRNFRRMFAIVMPLVALVVLAAPSAVHAATAAFTVTAATPAEFSGDNIQVGSLFQVGINTVTATEVGAYIPTSGTGFRNAEDVHKTAIDFTGLLYSVSGSSSSAGSYTLIEKVLIPAGTVINSNNFAYASFFSPHILIAGDQYAVTAWAGDPDATSVGLYTWTENGISISSVTTDPNLTRLSTQFVIDSGPLGVGAPTHTNPSNSDFGGNLLVMVPEPTSIGLLALGGIMLLRRRR